jgi:WD40 repeat protein
MADMTSATLVDRELTHPPLKLGLQGRLRACEVSPDGKWVVTCTVGSDGSSKPVRIWGGKDGRPVADLPLSGSTWWASFSPDGQWLATYDESESQLWKVGSWSEPVRSWEGSVLFSPDGKRMAVNDVVGSVRLVEIESGDEVARFTGPERNKYWPQCFTPDGTRLIALGQGLCVWDFRLIRGQLSAMGLDWDPKHWPPFPKAVPDPRGRLRLIVDTGTSLRADSAITSPRPQGPTPETGRPR